MSHETGKALEPIVLRTDSVWYDCLSIFHFSKIIHNLTMVNGIYGLCLSPLFQPVSLFKCLLCRFKRLMYKSKSDVWVNNWHRIGLDNLMLQNKSLSPNSPESTSSCTV